jgi:hypothetical protein
MMGTATSSSSGGGARSQQQSLSDLEYTLMDPDALLSIDPANALPSSRRREKLMELDPTDGIVPGAEVTPEMAVAAVAASVAAAAAASHQQQGPAHPQQSNMTPSLVLCQNWLAAHHGHLDGDGDGGGVSATTTTSMTALTPGSIVEEPAGDGGCEATSGGAGGDAGDDYLPMTGGLRLQAAGYQSAPNSAPAMGHNK